MKGIKFLFGFLTICLFAGFVSCGGEDDGIVYPKTLTYKESQHKESKQYVGSVQGGQEVVIAQESDPLKSLKDLLPDYSSNTITFENDSVLKLRGDGFKYLGKDSFKYKFEDGALNILIEDNKWDLFCFGNKNLLQIRGSISIHGKSNLNSISMTSNLENSLSVQYNCNRYENLQSMLDHRTNYYNLSEMKLSSEIIAWFNIEYTFE